MTVFKPRLQSRSAAIQPGDTLNTIAGRESANGNPISEDDISQFNFGSVEPFVVQEELRDKLGATQRLSNDVFTLNPEDEQTTTLLIPEPFRFGTMKTGKRHVIKVRKLSASPQFLGCAPATEVGFDFDSSFLGPNAKPQLAAMKTLAETRPDAKLFVFGHTDAVGDDLYNKKLSERRAWAVQSYLIGDSEAWEVLYGREDWGTREIQVILSALGHDLGEIDGQIGTKTRAAMRQFMGFEPDDQVVNDASFRATLFEAYMHDPEHPSLSSDRFLEDGFMGCGEANLADDTDAKSATNRRVVLYLFHPARLPRIPCKFADTVPCEKRVCETSKRYSPGFSCSFYDTVARPCSAEAFGHAVAVLFHLEDEEGGYIPHDHSSVRLTSSAGGYNVVKRPDQSEPYDDQFRILRFDQTPPGETYTLSLERDDDHVHKVFEGVPWTVLHDHGPPDPSLEGHNNEDNDQLKETADFDRFEADLRAEIELVMHGDPREYYDDEELDDA